MPPKQIAKPSAAAAPAAIAKPVKATKAVATEKAHKWYPADEDRKIKKSRSRIRPWEPRKSLQPGTILILLAGRFRGKRVVLLRTLEEGTLLVTGPYKINGVPLRRVNAAFVIATSTRIDVSGVEESKLNELSRPEYFVGSKKTDKASEEAFFKNGEKARKKPLAANRRADQKAVDQVLISQIKKMDYMASYLAASFSLRKHQKPHEMKW